MDKKLECKKPITKDQFAIIICRKTLHQSSLHIHKRRFVLQSRYNLLSYQNYRRNSSEYYFKIKEIEELKLLNKLGDFLISSGIAKIYH